MKGRLNRFIYLLEGIKNRVPQGKVYYYLGQRNSSKKKGGKGRKKRFSSDLVTWYIYIHINLHGTFCVQRKRHVFFVHSSCNYFFFSFFPSHFVVWKRKEKKKNQI